jgi:hypothetical protein
MLPEIVRFIISVIIMVLSFACYFMVRYIRKHPPKNENF